MKSIGLSDEVYERLIATKHRYESAEKRIISFDKLIEKLIGENEDGRDTED